jgi:hypothetical protein
MMKYQSKLSQSTLVFIYIISANNGCRKFLSDLNIQKWNLYTRGWRILHFQLQTSIITDDIV